MRGSTVSLDRVLSDIRARDLRDSMRATAPMVPAADAALLDTSFLSIEASVQRAIAIVEARLQHKPVPIG
jgi:cytidylate kinase